MSRRSDINHFIALLFLVFATNTATAQQDSANATRLYQLAEEMKEEDPDKAYQYLDSLYQCQYEPAIYRGYVTEAGILRQHKEGYASARALLDKATAYWTDEYPEDQLRVQIEYGDFEHDIGNFTKAIEYNIAALKIAETVRDTQSMIMMNNNLGYFYCTMIEDCELAIPYLLSTIELEKSLGEIWYATVSCLNLFEYYLAEGDTANAIKYSELGYELGLADPENTDNVLEAYRNYSRYFELTRDFSTALSIASKGYKIINDDGIEGYWKWSYDKSMARLNYKNGNYKIAYEQSKSAVKYADNSGQFGHKYDTYAHHWRICLSNGNYDEAYRATDSILTFLETFRAEQLTEKMQQNLYRREVEQKIKALEISELEQQISEDKAKVRLILVVIAVGLIALIAAFLLSTLSKNRDINQLNRNLEASLHTMEQQKHLIEKQYDTVQQEKEELVSEVEGLKSTESFVVLPSSGLQIDFDDILYIEASRNYVLVYTAMDEVPLTERIVFNELVNRLPTDRFVRIHRSFCINKNQISRRLNKSLVQMKNGVDLKISRSFTGEL